MKFPSPTRAQHSFAQVPRATIPRSVFNRSHRHKLTFDAGYLIPVLVDEALPGDTVNCRMSGFARLATPLKPLMDDLYLETFFFAVPFRLVWDNWEKFNGAQTNRGDSTSFVIPQMTPPAGGYTIGSVQDYMGIPTGIVGFNHSALWLRGYMLIWNEWFRDQNLQSSGVVPTGNGPDTPASWVPLKRGKRHDYFTSCLPWPQKGTAVSLPLGTTAPVVPTAGNSAPTWRNAAASANAGVFKAVSTADPTAVQVDAATGSFSAGEQLYWQGTGLITDLATATAATINQLRQAFQIQKLLERDARGGTRYTEIVKAHFGVTSPDARLQRPEYLGGGSAVVMVSPIAQTSSTDATTPQANLAGIGTGSWQGHGFVKSFTEHCLIIGLVCARAELTYQQGLERMWSRNTRYDFYWPALAQIGEQGVLNKEIFVSGVPATDDAVFGYQERYAEYRYKPSRVSGLFRSAAATTLDVWHLAQDFAALPALNATFIQEDPPIDRVLAVADEPHFIMDSYFEYKWARPMPVYGIPGMIDHF